MSQDPESNTPKLEKRLLTFLLSKKVPPLPAEDERKPYGEFSANIISRITFAWLLPLLRVGYKRTLESEDLFYLTDNLRVDALTETFNGHFTRELLKAQGAHLVKKCKERGETLDTSSVSSDEDLRDFTLSRKVTLYSLFLTFRNTYSFAVFCLCISFLAQTLNPLLIKHLIKYVELKGLGIETGIGKGIGYAFGCTGLILLNGIALNHSFYKSMSVGSLCKAVLTKSLLDKSFKLNAESRHKYPSGKITSMMGTDLSRIDFALGFQQFLIAFPVPIIVAIVVLITNIGAVALLGLGIMFLFIVAITLTTKKLFKFRKSATIFTDSRVNFIKECLNNLRIIKFYSWEPAYFQNIAKVRSKEMKIVYKMQVLRNIVTAVAMTLSLFCSMVTFLVLYGIGGNRDPASIFSSLTLFNVLTQVIFMMPMALASGSDALVGVGRVGDFMAAPEIKESESSIVPLPEFQDYMQKNNIAIKIDKATFEWQTFKELDSEADKVIHDSLKEDGDKITDSENEKDINEKNKEKESKHPAGDEVHPSHSIGDSDSATLNNETFPGLNNLDFELKRGEFVVITGLIGSGKSSLLNAISGFMKRVEGSVNVDGSLILCGQPWIQNATVKENIVFGAEYNEKKYADVIYACSLESDLAMLPAGDRTEIGERGITLSGGQKARISLARSVYFDKEVVLLDDVLSAVDARVGKHIMENCILGLLKEKTRILATHQLSLIGSADRIIFLNGDGSIDIGTYDELHSRNNGFIKLMAFNQVTEETDEEGERESLKETEGDVYEDEENILTEKLSIQKQVSKISKGASHQEQYVEEEADEDADDEGAHKDYNKDKTADGRLVLQEAKAVNGVSNIVYRRFITNASGVFNEYILIFLLLLFMAMASFSMIFTNTWLSFWTEKRFDISDATYIGVYVMFAFSTFILFTVEFVMVVYICNTAAKNLTIKAIEKVLYSKMSFLDTTPMGRILNRFTKDADVLDNEIGENARYMIFTIGNIVGFFVLCIAYLPWFAIAIPILGSVFLGVGSFYSSSNREIKRLEAVQRSFVYNNFNEALSGMATIKAYGADDRFLSYNAKYLDKVNESYLLTNASQRWLTINLALIASGFTLVIAMLCVNRVFDISPSSSGLLLSYTLQMTAQFSLLIRNFTQVENAMNSVERLCDFAYDLVGEAPYVISETTPAPEWPQAGAITFNKSSLAYRPGLPLVLKDLEFKVNPQEKIGICGRTGAGKSSIMTALYRLAELDSGSILIDDVDISTIGLKDLRTKLSIIPQDPVLFRGTIRKNLDPFDQSSDSKLWDALRRAGLIDAKIIDQVINQSNSDELHKFHLDQTVDDDGANFSLGERQLIAFARALVRDSKILILDEATSSVDYETDAKIQGTIATEFNQCTILCIAHRLKTIINYDKILVLDKGEVKEFDTPWNLFNTEDSIFQKMCQKSSIVSEDFDRREKI